MDQDNQNYTEIEFLEILSGTRDDYADQEEKAKSRFEKSTYIRAICLILIPVFTFWNCLNGGVVILLTAVISFNEFYVKFNRFEEKLHLLNSVITSLNNEYYNYYYDCKEYASIDSDNKFTTFVERTTTLIKETDLKLNNNYNTEDAIKKINYKSKS